MQEFHSKVIDRFFFSLVEPSIGLFSLRISFIFIFSPDAEQTGIFTSLNQALKNFFKNYIFSNNGGPLYRWILKLKY